MSTTWWFIVRGNELLVISPEGGASIPTCAPDTITDSAAGGRIGIGSLPDGVCITMHAGDEFSAPPGMSFVGLRSLYKILEEPFFRMAMTAVHLIEWNRSSRFCGRCGTSVNYREDLKAKECPACSNLIFPRISPAVIVLVYKGKQLLLARAARFTENMYSVLAGFVEAGESLEETVFREVKEETGVDVKNITYFGSQPWPFPDSLMVAFTAEYDKGELRIDEEEIVEADWYEWNKLPKIPGRISIARRLIDWFVERNS